MSDLVGNPEDRFSRVEALIISIIYNSNDQSHNKDKYQADKHSSKT